MITYAEHKKKAKKVKIPVAGVTLRDVAKACGLSVYPVSRALNGKSGVTAETLDKVRKAARELGYNHAQNDLARRLSMRKSGETVKNNIIGLLMPKELGSSHFHFELFQGVAHELSNLGYGLLMVPAYNLQENKPIEAILPPSIMRGEVDGLIIHQGFDEEHINKLRNNTGFGDRPIVAMSEAYEQGPAVLRDERGGAKLALSHLISQGHKKIIYFYYDTEKYPCSERLAGYIEACEDAGVDSGEYLVGVKFDPKKTIDKILQQALDKHPDATALMALNDPNAIESCYALQRIGKQVPLDISVIGWDDSDPYLDAEGSNQLTSIHFDLDKIGSDSAKLLISIIEGKESADKRIIIPATLKIRKTTTIIN